MSSQTNKSQSSIAEEYKQYGRSNVIESLAQIAHGFDYCGQTSSATFTEIIKFVNTWSLSHDAVLLDAGCGSGCFTFPLSEHLGIKLIGIDLSQDLIEKAKTHDMKASCHFIQGDYAQLPVDVQQLDGIMCIGSMYWNQSLDAVFQCWNERLKKGGKCLIFLNVSVTPLTEEEQNKAGDTRFFVESTLVEKIAAYFRITQCIDQNETYIAWLQRWCRGMEEYWEAMVREFGQQSAESMKIRFNTYLDFAKSGKTKRLVIVSEKTNDSKK